FADPQIYDTRLKDHWRFNSAKNLLSPDQGEPTSSSLLSILNPLKSPTGVSLELETDKLCTLLLQDPEEWERWAQTTENSKPTLGFSVSLLLGELRTRRRLITAIESYLMANRGTEPFDAFLQKVTQLTVETLAYSLADDVQKSELVGLFKAIAQFVESRTAAPENQASYAKTLLGIDAAQKIQAWTTENRDTLLTLDSNEEILAAIWPPLTEYLQNKFFTLVMPQALPFQLATKWLQGCPYQELFAHAVEAGATKAWGTKRRKLQDDDIIAFCQSTLGFECPLFISAVTQFLFDNLIDGNNAASPFLHFHKALKYGIPDTLAISCYESGFADRMLAQVLRDAVLSDGYTGQSFMLAIAPHREKLTATLSDYPSYFESVLTTLQ
ncbi:MAG: hypothetical protein KC587_18725, partial [Nitrospira sp.]|nr:hypothetical protein [Nitrospira sp.]